jgi:hypothetical protein
MNDESQLTFTFELPMASVNSGWSPVYYSREIAECVRITFGTLSG